MRVFQQIKNKCLSESFRSLMLCLIVVLLFVNFADRRWGINETNGHLEQFQISRLMPKNLTTKKWAVVIFPIIVVTGNVFEFASFIVVTITKFAASAGAKNLLIRL